jgi:hypothetical protein
MAEQIEISHAHGERTLDMGVEVGEGLAEVLRAKSAVIEGSSPLTRFRANWQLKYWRKVRDHLEAESAHPKSVGTGRVETQIDQPTLSITDGRRAGDIDDGHESPTP